MQQKYYCCAPAVAKMIVYYLGYGKTQDDLRRHVKTSIDGGASVMINTMEGLEDGYLIGHKRILLG